MTQSPFIPVDKPLKTILAEKFILPLAKWMTLGTNDLVMGTIGNSVWESAFTIMFLIETIDVMKKEQLDKRQFADLKVDFDTRILKTTKWLLSKSTDRTENTEFLSWDGLTWDTSVVLRSLLHVLRSYKELDEKLAADIERSIARGISWLITEFDEWRTRSYTAGPQDVAEVLILLTELSKKYPDLYKKIVDSSSWKGKETQLKWEIAKLLIQTRSEAISFSTAEIGKDRPIALWWGEFFGTAEVLEALGVFYQHQIGTRDDDYATLEPNKIILQAIRETLIQATLYFDFTQNEGTWGSAVTDTARVAITYVNLASTLSFIQPNDFVVFTSLRWLCADSQVMSDGSFLHSLFLSVYYSHALLAYYSRWELSEMFPIDIYDKVLSSAMVKHGLK